MNRLLTAISVLALALMLPGGSASARWIRPEMRVVIPPSSLQTATPGHNVVRVTTQVQSMQLDLQNLGKAPITGHGHIQVYFDHIPPAGYIRPALDGLVAMSTTESFSLGFSPAAFVRDNGTHTLIVALARNDDVLYAIPYASMRVTLDGSSLARLRH